MLRPNHPLHQGKPHRARHRAKQAAAKARGQPMAVLRALRGREQHTAAHLEQPVIRGLAAHLEQPAQRQPVPTRRALPMHQRLVARRRRMARQRYPPATWR
jgi:hypothetical protein